MSARVYRPLQVLFTFAKVSALKCQNWVQLQVVELVAIT